MKFMYQDFNNKENDANYSISCTDHDKQDTCNDDSLDDDRMFESQGFLLASNEVSN